MAVSSSLSAAGGSPEITTDKWDYQPGDTVLFIGANWDPYDTIYLTIWETPWKAHNHKDTWTVADGAGEFLFKGLPITTKDLGQGFKVTAIGGTTNGTAHCYFTDAGILGIAPFINPEDSMDIDGDLVSNYPTNDKGDWYYSGSGTGGGVLTSGGVPINSSETFHSTDLYNSSSDNKFSGGDKVDHDPSTWGVVNSTVNNKSDLHNALVHFSKDTGTGHIWAAVGGDRYKTNGDDYIDFEFLQNTLKVSGSNFLTNGPHGGRTVGDLLISIEFTNGGGISQIFAYRWEALSGGGYGYDSFLPPTGTIYVYANPATTSVPWGAFGSTTYDPNQFGEAAIDLNALIPGYNDCIGISTVMIKTKTSQSFSAQLEDMVTPIQVKLGTKPEVTVVGKTVCSGSDSLSATVSFGAGPFTYIWKGPSSFYDSFVTSSTTRKIKVITAGNYILIVKGKNGCTSDPDTAVFTVLGSPTALTITGSAFCASSPNSGTISSTTSQTGINYQLYNSSNVAVQTAKSGTGSALTWTALGAGTGYYVEGVNPSNPSCKTTSDTANVREDAAPTAAAGADQTKCATSSFTMAGNSVSSPLSGTWAFVGASGGAAITSASSHNTTVTGVPVNTNITLEWTVSNGVCTSASDQVVIRNDEQPTAAAGADQAFCEETTFTMGANAVSSPLQGTWSFVSTPGTAVITNVNDENTTITSVANRTYILQWTVANGVCTSASDQVVIRSDAQPFANAGIDQNLCGAGNPDFTLDGNEPTIGTGSWTVISGTGVLEDETVYNTLLSDVVAGTSTELQWTIENGTCISQSNVVCTMYPAVITSAGTDQETCANAPNFTLAGNISGGASSGTWTGGSGSFNPNASALNAVYTPSSAEISAGELELILVSTDPVGPCPYDEDTINLVINPLPTVTLSDLDNVCHDSAAFALSGGLPLGGTYSGPGVSGNWFDPSQTGVETVTIKYSYEDSNGCKNSTTKPLKIEQCGTTFCTLTQGAYGSKGGKSCYYDSVGLTQVTTLAMLRRLLATDLIVGIPATSCTGAGATRSFTIAKKDTNYVIAVLPAGGPSKKIDQATGPCSSPLSKFNSVFSTTGSIVPSITRDKKNGTIANTLIGQTMTIKLNVRGNSDLLGLAITKPYMFTQRSQNCSTGRNIGVGDEQVFLIPANLKRRLGSNFMVRDMIKLADSALAGSYTPPSSADPDFADITAGLDAINRGFDECRLLVGFSNSTTRSDHVNYYVEDQTEVEVEQAGFRLMPNPAASSVALDVSSFIGKSGVIRITNMLGVTLYTVNAEEMNTIFYTLNLDDAGILDGVYFVSLEVNGKVYTEKLIVTRE